MNTENNETIADIVADIRAQNQGLPEDSYALSPLVCDLLSLADRIFAAHTREMADEKRISDAVIKSLRDKKLEMAGEITAKDAEIARLRALVERAREVTEIISQPNRGARRIAETTEAIDPTHSAVRKG